MQRFSGKTALVAGGSRGIGAAVARRLAGEGAAEFDFQVWPVGHDQMALLGLAHNLQRVDVAGYRGIALHIVAQPARTVIVVVGIGVNHAGDAEALVEQLQPVEDGVVAILDFLVRLVNERQHRLHADNVVDGVDLDDVHVGEAGLVALVRGAVAVNRVGVRSSGRELLSARRVEASGLEVQWPTRLAAKRLVVSEPRALVERDPGGGFPLTSLMTRPAGPSTASESPSLGLEVEEVVVRGGAAAWRDQAVDPPVAVDFSRIEARLTGAA